jgi:hypothetical protein
MNIMAKAEPNFMGKDSFFWWMGVVEDRRDTKKVGRCRVRILGCHTENKQLIPTCELHWAYPYQPLTWNQAMNGLGHSPTGPAEGTWVFGFFKDGQSAQDPVILGTIAGIPEEAPQPSIGFYDPGKPFHEVDSAPRKIRIRHYPNDGSGAQNKNESKASLYPRETHPWGCVIGEPDVNRLARVEQVDDTIIGVRKRQRDVGRKSEFGGIPIAMVHPTPARKWVEPQPGYNAKYPYNHVYESESGHIIEIDDTPGAERIHIWHRSGTYLEIQDGLHGDFVMKCVGKRFEVTMENAYSHYQNAMNLTVDGECNVYCRSNANVQVDGDLKLHVQGNVEEKVHGNWTTDIDGNRTVKIGGYDQQEVGGNQSMHAGGVSDRHSGGAMFDIAGGQIKQSAGGSFIMASGGTLSGDASAVHWNSGKGSTSSPTSPQKPAVPPFPAALGMAEGRNESGADPEREEKPDPNPQSAYQHDC